MRKVIKLARSHRRRVIEVPSSIVFSDSFTDTEGKRLNLHSPEIGKVWIEGSGTFDINTDRASVLSLVGGWCTAYTDPGAVARGIKFKWRYTTQSNGYIRLAFRRADGNNQFWVEFYAMGNDAWLKKRVASATSTLDTAAPTIAVETWYQCWIDIGAADDVISVYHATEGSAKPGSPILQATDTDLNTATEVALLASQLDYRWDDLIVYREGLSP